MEQQSIIPHGENTSKNETLVRTNDLDLGNTLLGMGYGIIGIARHGCNSACFWAKSQTQQCTGAHAPVLLVMYLSGSLSRLTNWCL